MGGANSEVTSGTTTILLESANFKPTSIYHTSRQLSLLSEASMRFERGIRPDLTIPALKHATQLIAELGGGKVARGIADVYLGKQEIKPIRLTVDKVNRTLALSLRREQIVDVLTALGFTCSQIDATAVLVSVPYWRSDIRQAIDLVEEVARIIGYDQIPLTLLSEPIPHQDPNPLLNLKRKLCQSLTSYGFQEIITFSLVSQDMLNKLMPEPHPLQPAPLRLFNPMTADQEYLRPTLRPNLLAALVSNRRHESGGIRLFELGRIYLPKAKDLPDEPEILCGLLSGNRTEKTWLTPAEPFNFFDVRGVVESLMQQLGSSASFVPSHDDGLHPARQAAIVINGKQLGVLGELHPKVASNFELGEPVYIFEINVNELLPFVTGRKLYQPVPRFPSIARDIALVVDAATPHQKVQDIITSFPMVTEVSLFDVYSGKQVAAGKKSLAYRLIYQSPDHTLTDDEVDDVQRQILEKLAKEMGATLRS